MTQDEKLRELLTRYTEGTATPEEISYLESRYIQWGQNKKKVASEDMLKTSDRLMWANISKRTKIQKDKEPALRKLWPRIKVAVAVAIIILSTGIWFLKYPAKENPNKQASYTRDIAPGKQGATLTLANGKKIRLTDAANGELAQEAGVAITKTASGQLIYEIKDKNVESDNINILATDNGETYRVRLPDGSSVWLNSASTLKYPASFVKLKNRRVELSGEGYFEIAKDKAHPFIVKTAEQEVEVLGTHFNINSYKDEPVIATTLIEGSVKITSNQNNKILKPGEQALNDGNSIKTEKVDFQTVIDWKNDEFSLDKVKFKVAMRKIARWYDVEIVYNETVPDDLEAGGWISRNEKLSAVLKSIESTGFVHFKIEGRKIYVSK